jgi:hypothetical protein
MTNDQINKFPTINILLSENFNLSIPPQNYLFPNPNNKETYCMGINSSSFLGVDFTIIGIIGLEGYHIMFDRNNSQIGFASISTCPTSS